ncbi:MAB_1171c family putative transporter [Streptomyces sp. NPDC057806]|uniref:MAB_1171c family putative transporter n=1 Tax=Streptomyces sp. NPDC057806 TaxID=3346255 RepID=UPI00369772A6
MSAAGFHIPYTLPIVLLILALGLKTPTFIRAWKDPDVRATTLFLLLASAVFVSAVPASIHRINTMAGVPNIAAPWVYSLLTAFCASCLTMVITWRDEPSSRRSDRIRRIWLIYLGIIGALWATFFLADAPTERIYDLDTYYARQPWMREHILLYLGAHMVSALVAAYMIWKWIPKVSGGWLKAGLVFLQAGYAFGLLFDVAKLTAVGARWTGGNLDWLSTKVAPPFAILDASLVGIGFILPQGGPFLQKWIRDQRTYRRLRPLARALQPVAPPATRARVGRFAPLDLRVLQRQQRIHDALLRLTPFLDTGLHQRAYEEARSAGHRVEHARGIAGAVAIRAALAASTAPPSPGRRPGSRAPAVRSRTGLDDLDAIAHALHRPRTVEAIWQRAACRESDTGHV